MAFSGLVCRANPHCTAESPCCKGGKSPLRRLIFLSVKRPSSAFAPAFLPHP
nr:MAG TPA: hypothetical protein [Caudoviricetes sp.]